MYGIREPTRGGTDPSRRHARFALRYGFGRTSTVSAVPTNSGTEQQDAKTLVICSVCAETAYLNGQFMTGRTPQLRRH